MGEEGKKGKRTEENYYYHYFFSLNMKKMVKAE
jgi:hypothetical protein